MNTDNIFNLNDENLEILTKLVAEIFDFRLAQFQVCVMGDNKLKEAIMQFDISFYQDIIARMETLSESSKRFEKAKLYGKILNKTGKELQNMCEHMDDLYYR